MKKMLSTNVPEPVSTYTYMHTDTIPPIASTNTNMRLSRTRRSLRDNKPESLYLTESVLRYTDARGSISVLCLEDVVGAQVGTFQKRDRGYGNNGQQERQRLKVFAYEPGGKLGCIPKR